MKRAPSNEPEEEEILPPGAGLRLRGESFGESGARGAASDSTVAVALKSNALPQEGQKRAAPETSFPQAGQLMDVAGVYH